MTDVLLPSRSDHSALLSVNSVTHSCSGSRHSPPPLVDSPSNFVGEPWRRRTNVVRATDMSGEPIIVLDGCHQLGLAEHIHDGGHGVARLGDLKSEHPRSGPEAETVHSRSPLQLTTRSCLLGARSVNELLMVMYDVLEVHRTCLYERKNIGGARWGSKNMPPTIQNVLAGPGLTGPAQDPVPFKCLIIDHDDAARLDSFVHDPQDLTRRTGTPMYVARGACLGVVFTHLWCHTSPRMPELSDQARALYVRVHGNERYERYNDKDGTRHGARPPDMDEEYETAPQFRHRPEHDVESVYWSMVSALLRVHPKGVDKETPEPNIVATVWNTLLSHKIPDQGFLHMDLRHNIVVMTQGAWRALFLGDMQDVGTLLHKISGHIIPEYALWDDNLQPDHLHEAVQRLILQYLTDHKDIPRDPEHVHPITLMRQSLVTRLSRQSLTEHAGATSESPPGTPATEGPADRALTDEETGGVTKLKSMDNDTALSLERIGSSASETRVTASPGRAIAASKRKSYSQTGRRTKRPRVECGAP
ncbi:hypothetical protein LXA43DRAFT_1005285 [Ganoderma leucocontextum]|nr:hypothetical protein LXA43DRAFT_1005285 [Ganoderma leucocontextum]